MVGCPSSQFYSDDNLNHCNEEVMEDLKSRKFLLTLLALVIAGVLQWFGKVDGAQWAAVTIACVTAYITGNVIQKQQEKK